MTPELDELADRLRTAARVVVLTGAGVSAASGVPTFRGSDGLWRQYRPQDLATPDAFARDPALVWEWYDWRRSTIARCKPNAAHVVLARWSTRLRIAVITQNVDGLHERAGTAGLLRFHGSIWHLRCAAACGAPEWEDRTAPFTTLPPRCPGCNGLARPGVVWFGESIDSAVLRRASDAAARADVFLSVGTSSVVYPAAGLLDMAHARGAFTAEINPEATASSSEVDLVIARGAEDVLPALDERMDERMEDG